MYEDLLVDLGLGLMDMGTLKIPDQQKGMALLISLVRDHDQELLASKSFTCCECGKKATIIINSPYVPLDSEGDHDLR